MVHIDISSKNKEKLTEIKGNLQAQYPLNRISYDTVISHLVNMYHEKQ